jgi:hypothetical protein
MSLPVPSPATTVTVFAALQHLPDPRDTRGKRHDLALVLCGVILAIMAGRSRVSALPRFLRNRFGWLRESTQAASARCISRAQFPRLLARVEWAALQPLLWRHVGVHVESPAPGEWIAIDGKALRGSPGEQVVLARTHLSGHLLAHQPRSGPKRSEVTTVRALVAQPPLAGQKITLDALPCHPLTTAQIHQAQGHSLGQVKANQAPFLTAVQTLTTPAPPVGPCQSVDKAQGRLEVRHATFFSLTALPLPPRWQQRGLSTVVRVARTTAQLTTANRTHTVAYDVTNQGATTPVPQRDLFTAIRGHWGCEADNWIRDVTLQTDQIPLKPAPQAHVSGTLRTLVLGLFRKAGVGKVRALLDDLADSPTVFAQLLRQVGFL